MTHHKSYLRMAHEYDASKEAYERTTQIMCTKVSIPVSDRYNSVYDDRDLHHALIALSISNGYAESGMRRLAIEADGKTPSGSWVRDRVASVGEGEMSAMLDRALDSTLAEVKSFKVFTSPVIAAVDTHDLPRYDRDLDRGFLRRGGRPERGTTKRESYATLQSVEEGRRAQIACERFGFFDEKDEVVERLLTTARLNEVDLSLLLLDRGFFSSPVVSTLERNGQTFLMPCILFDGIKRAIIEYAEGRRKRVSRYEMGPKENRVSFNLVILPKAGASKDEEDPLKRFIPFATNMSMKRIVWNVRRLPIDYRMRWGIETGYSGMEQLRARTTSRNHSLRLLYLFYSLILYNAWLIANLILAKRFAKTLGKPIIPIQIVKAALLRIVIESYRSG